MVSNSRPHSDHMLKMLVNWWWVVHSKILKERQKWFPKTVTEPMELRLMLFLGNLWFTKPNNFHTIGITYAFRNHFIIIPTDKETQIMPSSRFSSQQKLLGEMLLSPWRETEENLFLLPALQNTSLVNKDNNTSPKKFKMCIRRTRFAITPLHKPTCLQAEERKYVLLQITWFRCCSSPELMLLDPKL